MVILYEANYGQRQIFTDGRSLPAGDRNPFWDGYSVGHVGRRHAGGRVDRASATTAGWT